MQHAPAMLHQYSLIFCKTLNSVGLCRQLASSTRISILKTRQTHSAAISAECVQRDGLAKVVWLSPLPTQNEYAMMPS
eukprot:1349223-Karenia_brevis.AAC.1